MTIKMFDKWVKVLEKQNDNITKELKNGEMTKDVYGILNNIIHNKYNQIISEYNNK